VSGAAGWRSSWRLALALLVGLLVAYYGYRTPPVALARDLPSFPTTLRDWRGEDVDPGREPVRAPGASAELGRVYRDPAGRSAHVYIAYFERQEQGRELVSYVTKDWHRQAEAVTVRADGGDVLVNRAVLGGNGGGQVVFFWYELNGRIVASRYAAKLATISDSVLRRRSNGALVAVVMPAAPSETGADLVVEVLRALRPILPAGQA
jgi:EpsI family protein